MACVRDNNDGTFSVIGKWGRRGNINQQSVKASVQSIVAAEVEQKKLFLEKIRKGYLDIDEPTYSGTVRRDSAFIIPNLEEETTTVPRKKRTPTPKQPEQVAEQNDVDENPPPVELEDEGVVVCVNSSGMEDKFDNGTEYVAEPHKDLVILWVYDKFGKKGEYFKDRFVSLSQYKNPMNFKKFAVGETITVNILKNRGEVLK
jgi:hypothetical protein